MTGFMSIIENIGHYAGVGMVLAVAGLIMIIVAIVGLARRSAADRRTSVAEFNQQFVRDTQARISDIQAGARRSQIAGDLGIGQKNHSNR